MTSIIATTIVVTIAIVAIVVTIAIVAIVVVTIAIIAIAIIAMTIVTTSSWISFSCPTVEYQHHQCAEYSGWNHLHYFLVTSVAVAHSVVDIIIVVLAQLWDVAMWLFFYSAPWPALVVTKIYIIALLNNMQVMELKILTLSSAENIL